MVTEMGTTKKIVVMSGKGGVGKSTVAANMAFGLASRGYKVGIMDSDFHGPTIPMLLGIKDSNLVMEGEKILPVTLENGIKAISMAFLLPDRDTPVIWRGPMKMNMISQFIGKVEWGDLDHLIIDLPPGTGDEPLSIAQELKEIDGALIVTTPQDVALSAVRRSIKFAGKLNMKVLGVIENMSDFKCPHCGGLISLFGKGGGKHMAEELEVDYLGSIPFDPDVTLSGESGTPFYDEDKESSKIFEDMIDEIVKKTR